MQPRWIGDGPALSYLLVDSATGERSLHRWSPDGEDPAPVVAAHELIDPLRPRALPLDAYEWSTDGSKVLVTGRLPARRLKTGGNFGVYDVASRSFRLLTDTAASQANIRLSPDGALAGFVRGNNLYVAETATGRIRPLTFDGSETILNGVFDWAYEEEFSIIEGWQWSPDGRHIAFWRIDQSAVPEFPLVSYPPDSARAVLRTMRYPKAGDPIPAVRIGVVEVASGRTRWMETETPGDHYVPRIRWTGRPGVLAIFRMNRVQDTLQLLLADVATGRSRVILTETSSAWVDVESTDLVFLRRAEAFLWTSRRDGWRHLYRVPLEGVAPQRLTSGEWEVTRLVHVDERRGIAYVVATEASPRERHLYSVRLAGGGMRRISRERGWHEPEFAPGGLVYLDTWSNATTPPAVRLHANDGERVATLVESRKGLLNGPLSGTKRFFTLRMPDGSARDASMILPPGMDTTRRHPLLFYVYGGPGSQLVRDAWGGTRDLWHRYLAGKGIVVLSIDNRGTGFRGAPFEQQTHRRLGQLETEDILGAARAVGRFPFIDSTRLGVWGWSGGGYFTLMAMTRGEGVFRAGIAVAPVTDFKFYDAIWTERYLGLPGDNPAGYAAASPLRTAGALRGDLLLVHGTTDDNVHWQNSIAFVGELVRSGIQVSTLYYPDRAHGLEGAPVHLYTAMTRFLLERL